MVDLTALDLVSAGRALRTGAVSSVELTQGYLDRIERIDATLHAFFAVSADHALEQARRADQDRAQGRDRGPLHGAPIAVKDLYETTFAPTTGALSHRSGFMAAANCHVVDRLEEAGAVILGKLATTEGAGIEHNPNWPTPLNPWNHAHWTGLSSSGSGVAMAARLCLGTLGSDTGGSIRFPAAACGITGLKPTFGRVSGAGVVELARGLDHFGPMVLSAADAALMLQVIAGRDPDDPRTAHAPDPADYYAAIDGGVQGLRIGVDRDVLEHRIDPAVSGPIEAALREMERAGATLVPASLPPMDDLLAAFSRQMGRETADAHETDFVRHEASYGPGLAQIIRGGMAINEAGLENARERLDRWNAALAETMDAVDMLALPVLAKPVHAIETMTLGLGSGIGTFTIPFNASGSPTINFPVGFDPAGLPVALQLVGPHWSEATLLRAAHAYQQRTDWHRRVPPAIN